MPVSSGQEQVLTIVDDCGLLAIADASTYSSFVGEDWTYEVLLAHFSKQMAARTILVWECGDGGDQYDVAIRQQFTAESGFREITGSLQCCTGELHLASYGALTMAAQFDDYVIPSKEETHLAFRAPLAGSVRVRIVQLFDPVSLHRPTAGQPHFVVELAPGTAPVWQGVAWETASAQRIRGITT